MSDESLLFPVGRFKRPAGPLTPAERETMIRTIADTPKNLAEALKGLTEKQIDTPYREGGWTVRQVVHHLGDSHMNAFIRMKLAITADSPTVTAYDEDEWAKLADAQMPIAPSVTLLTALHERWVKLLHSMKPADFQRTVTHPENGLITVDFLLALYSWHGPHHVGHVKLVRT
jgi:uncharacterized damage-inducible protein DinB